MHLRVFYDQKSHEWILLRLPQEMNHSRLLPYENLPQCFILLFLGRLTMHILLRILVPLYVLLSCVFKWTFGSCLSVALFRWANKWVGSDTLSRGFYRSRAPRRGKVMKTNTAISRENLLRNRSYDDANAWNIVSLELTLWNINLWNNGLWNNGLIMIAKYFRRTNASKTRKFFFRRKGWR